MDWQNLLKYILIGAIAGSLGYFAYQRSEFLAALVVVFTVSWLLYRFSGYQLAWDTLSAFKNPFMMAIIVGLAGISYYALEGNFLPESLGFGFGLALLGAALAMLLYKYWHIGEG